MRYCQPKLLSNADYERKLNPFPLENMLESPILNIIKPIYAFKGHSDKFPKQKIQIEGYFQSYRSKHKKYQIFDKHIPMRKKVPYPNFMIF